MILPITEVRELSQTKKVKCKIEFVRWYLTGDFLHFGVWLLLRCIYAAVSVAGGDLPWLDLSLLSWITTVSELVASFSLYSSNIIKVVLLETSREQGLVQILSGLKHIHVSSLILFFQSSSGHSQGTFCNLWVFLKSSFSYYAGSCSALKGKFATGLFRESSQG